MAVALIWSAILASTALAEERPVRSIPALPNAPRLDGNLKRFAPSIKLKPTDVGESRSSFSAQVAYWRDTLFLGVEVVDDNLLTGDILNVAMHFPGAGITARGYTYRFAADGKRAPDRETGPPPFANNAVRAAMRRTDRGMVLEAAFPAKSLPRFPAQEPLILEMCLSYEDRDEVAGAPTTLSNCVGGSMQGEVLTLPDAFRRNLKTNPPKDVVGLEGREHGWVGFALLHYPIWMIADRPMTPEVLRTFFLEELHDPAKERISFPSRLHLPDGRRVAAIVTGKDPFVVDGRCDPKTELKMGLYVLQDKSARRVLEWPAASCTLGRATSVVLDNEGALSVGYASGTTINFIWSNDHFERTEIG